MWYQYGDGNDDGNAVTTIDHHDVDEKFIKNTDITKHKTWSE